MAKKKNFDNIVEESFHEGYHSDTRNPVDLAGKTDEEFAGRMLYKRAQRISLATAEALLKKAKSDDEREFYRCLCSMALRRKPMGE